MNETMGDNDIMVHASNKRFEISEIFVNKKQEKFYPSIHRSWSGFFSAFA